MIILDETYPKNNDDLPSNIETIRPSHALSAIGTLTMLPPAYDVVDHAPFSRIEDGYPHYVAPERSLYRKLPMKRFSRALTVALLIWLLLAMLPSSIVRLGHTTYPPSEVSSRHNLGELVTLLSTTALRLLGDVDGEARDASDRERKKRALDDPVYFLEDYLCVAVHLPKYGTVPRETSVKCAVAPSAASMPLKQWHFDGPRDNGRSGAVSSARAAPAGGRGGHRGGRPDMPGDDDAAARRGRRGRGKDCERSERRAAPPEYDSFPPGRGGGGDRGRGERRFR